MSTRIAQIFATGTGAVNHEGAPTYEVSQEEYLLRLLLTGMTGNTYYVEEKKLAEEAVTVFREFAERDPHFLAQAIVYAREQGYMRLAPITALVVLSAASSAEAKRAYRAILSRVCLTPGDIQDVMQLIRKAKLRGMGQMIRKSIGQRLAELSEYHIIKYGSEQQNMALRDIHRLVRQKPGKFPADWHAQEKAAYLVKGTEPLTLAQLRGYELFKRMAKAARDSEEAETLTETVLELISEFRLPWEVVTSQMPSDRTLWRHLMVQMPIFALLRNLRNLVKYEVFTDGAALEYVEGVLTDPERVRKSKLFPFRFFAAAEALRALGQGEVTTRLLSALDRALEISYANLPYLGESVLIANDVSGSMSSKASDRSDMTMADIAALAAAALYKRSEMADIVSFDTQAYPRKIDREQRIMQIARAISGHGGGTTLHAPIQWAFGQASAAKKYDTAIFLTDSESWVDEIGRGNTRSLELIRAYRRKVNPNLVCAFVKIQPYKHSPVPMTEPGCYFISGWSDQVLSTLGLLRQQSSLLDTVRQVQID